MASRTGTILRRVGQIAAVLALGLGAMFVLMVGVSWILGERSGLTIEAVGIATIDGTPTVISCRGGVGFAQVTEGDSPDGPVIWSATATGVPSATVPIIDPVQGYAVRSTAVVEPGRTYSLTELTGKDGVNDLASIVPFDPANIPDGEVLIGDGTTLSIPEFTNRTTGCVLR